ncbi:BMP family ABC transporter substrate-binding protein, partial [Candidatus Poribacteria bacterium]
MSTPMQISVVYPGDCLGDSSFCDVLYHGVKKAKTEPGVEIAEIESNAAAWETDLREAAQQSGLVLTSGFQMSEPLAKVAPEFPDVKFVIFVGAVDLPNVASYAHKANEGAFLVGAIAGLTS